MAQVKKSITVSEQQDAWIKAQIACGDYASDSEVIRALIRKEQKTSETPVDMGKIIDEGMKTHAVTMKHLAE